MLALSQQQKLPKTIFIKEKLNASWSRFGPVLPMVGTLDRFEDTSSHILWGIFEILSGCLISNIVLLIYNGHYETIYYYEWFVYFKSSSSLGGSICAPLCIYWCELMMCDGVENKWTSIDILLKINLHQINLSAHFSSHTYVYMSYDLTNATRRNEGQAVFHACFPMKEVRQIYAFIFQYKYVALGFICADFFLRILVILMKCSGIKTRVYS
jgi:hypothetical protein